MFSKYKKQAAKPVAPPPEPTAAPAAAPAPAASLRRPVQRKAAEAQPMDKERKRKERLGEIKIQLHRELLENLNLAALERAGESELRSEIASIATEILAEKSIVLNREDRQQLNKELYDEVTGLGPLETLLQDETVSDILVNGPHQIFVERSGKLQVSDITFKDEKHLMRIIDKIVSAVGRRVDESNPYVDARLADGSRFNAMVPPIAVDGSLVSIRKFKKDKLGIDDLVQFGAFTEEMAAYLQAAVSTRLNVIVSGGTGSGKTTTLHAILGYLNTPEKKIWTAEDPVEITQPGLQQVQVSPKIGFTFANALRAFLRADPDIILIGEMRDKETAHAGIEASLTGHLVLSTLHTNSAPETITRLLDLGLDPVNFSDACVGILAQRLIRTLCSSCKEKHPVSDTDMAFIRRQYGEEYIDELNLPDNLEIYRAKGCDDCGDTGYRGRTGVHELLGMTPALRSLVYKEASVAEMKAQAMQDGMRTLNQDAIYKVIKGDTDLAQVQIVGGD